MMNNSGRLDGAVQNAATVSICDTQPVTAEGIRTLLKDCPDLKFLHATDSLGAAIDLTRDEPTDLLIVDKAFGTQAILDLLSSRSAGNSGHEAALPHPSMVVWGVSVTEAEALRILQAGGRGILRKSAALASILACLRTVAAGRSWMEDCVFRNPNRADRYARSELTTREQQVLELVEQGCKNKEIAQHLGIRPGTVKIHLKHIFEKTGIRGRYGLALNGLRDREPAREPANISA